MRLNTRGNNFLENFGDKVQIRNRTKVVEIIIRKRRFFELRMNDCLFEWRWKDAFREKFMILMPSSSKQSFKRKVGLESSSQCLIWEKKIRSRFFEKVVGLKLDKFGGGMIGKRKGSGKSDGENLERMRSILPLKMEEWIGKWLCVGCVRGWIGWVAVENWIRSFPKCARVGGWFSDKI